MDSYKMSQCETGNDFDGRIGVRISAIFVYAARHRGAAVPEWAFFFAKYFGSGVIVATAFIHLLSPAYEALSNECLSGPITEYDWVAGICLMTVFVLFFLELMTMRFAKFGHSHSHGDPHEHEESNEVRETQGQSRSPMLEPKNKDTYYMDEPSEPSLEPPPERASPQHESRCPTSPYVPGDDHLSHSRDHPGSARAAKQDGRSQTFNPESYAAQMTAIFILEFGVVFHSIFIGLTLAVSGAEFVTLYIVLTFHQTFEGLALGSRLGSIRWSKDRRWTPYIMGLGYALSTPIATAIGIGVRQTFDPESQTTLIVNGVFDSISAGILIYTGLVELMAHEFMFSSHMQTAPLKEVLTAVVWMVLGALLMAILGKWA
ncbi:hypothetical protein AC579_3758 [Pseudocercospora musae]|uniref:ZIP zinc/iron transport family n=1 Tax=Pseudocercospora musae TaxID=113226 RepID=A0A139IP31_9PEZI|nr:hypothetical protein AC579_3758 [Pseudocercospora musae]